MRNAKLGNHLKARLTFHNILKLKCKETVKLFNCTQKHISDLEYMDDDPDNHLLRLAKMWLETSDDVLGRRK